MTFRPIYLDTSAIVKLIVHEPETPQLFAALEQWPDRLSSALARVEVHRALRRSGRPKSDHTRADAVLDSLVLIHVAELVLRLAASFRNPQVRSLDAIHLATALSIGDDPEGLITYDARLARIATLEGVAILHPGLDRLK